MFQSMSLFKIFCY